MPTLTIQLPGRPAVEHNLGAATTTLGRAASNTIALDNSSISQLHAEIARVGNDYVLRDHRSTNGTQLNGQSITEARLRDGDVLKLGEVIAVFHVEFTLTPVLVPALPVRNPALDVATKSEKSDTTVLSTKAKTTLLKPVSPSVGVAPPPPPPPPERKSSITVVASILAGLLVAGIAGFIGWKQIAGRTPEIAVTTPPNSVPPPALVTNVPATNTPVEPVELPPAAEPALMGEMPPAIADATNTTAQPETNNLPELLAALRSSDVAERRNAARQIGALDTGLKSAVLNLRLAVLQDADLEVRAWLVIALVKNQAHDPAALPILVAALSHESAPLRQRACAVLALIPHDESSKATVVAALKSAADDESEEVRKEALAALKLIAPEESK